MVRWVTSVNWMIRSYCCYSYYMPFETHKNFPSRCHCHSKKNNHHFIKMNYSCFRVMFNTYYEKNLNIQSWHNQYVHLVYQHVALLYGFGKPYMLLHRSNMKLLWKYLSFWQQSNIALLWKCWLFCYARVKKITTMRRLLTFKTI